MDTKAANACRFLFQNVNGIKSSNQFSHALSVAVAADSTQIDFLGLAETNVDWQNPLVNAKIIQQFCKALPNLSVATSSSIRRPLRGQPYQPGGTCTLVHGDWKPHCQRSSDSTGLGRWSIQFIQGREGLKIAAITAYRVCAQNISHVGSSTAYAQQWSILRGRQPITRTALPAPNPRREMITNLRTSLLDLTAHGYAIILMIDANESTEANNSQIGRLAVDTKLIDLHMTRHSSTEDLMPSTYSCGSRKIDFVFISSSLLPYVTKVGMLPLHHLITSNHCGLFFDIRLGAYLRGHPPPCLDSTSRLLNSHHVRQAMQYKAKLITYRTNHRVFARAATLHYMATDPTVPDVAVHHYMNQINEDLLQGMLHSERASSSQFHNPWSPTVIQARHTIRYWESWLTEHNTGCNLSAQRAYLTSLMWTVPTIPDIISRGTLHRSLRSAHKALRAILRNADTLCDQFLEARSDHYAAIHHQDKAKLLLNMRQAEAYRRMFARFRIIMGKVTTGALSSLRVPNPQSNSADDYITLYDPEEIESHLLQRNQEHFGQATGTPFTCKPQVSHIGRNAEHGFAGALSALCDSTDEATVALLEQALAHKLPAISCAITVDDIIGKFKKWKESTATSPNGNHLGHYKALLVPDPLPSPTEPNDQSVTPSPDRNRPIFEIMATLLTTSFHRGLVAQRWLKVFSAMIEKIPGNPLINKLRVIHLFDCLWNLGLGVIWSRRLLPQAKRHGTINEGQWGSRKGRWEIDCVAVKEFTMRLHATCAPTL